MAERASTLPLAANAASWCCWRLRLDLLVLMLLVLLVLLVLLLALLVLVLLALPEIALPLLPQPPPPQPLRRALFLEPNSFIEYGQG